MALIQCVLGYLLVFYHGLQAAGFSDYTCSGLAALALLDLFEKQRQPELDLALFRFLGLSSLSRSDNSFW